MISRYSRPEMAAVWALKNLFLIMFEIEACACDALAEAGVIPAEAAKAVRDWGDKPYTPDRIARIDEIEAETKHDVIAFLTELSEQVGEEARCAPTRELSGLRSKSPANWRHRPLRAKVRATTRRRGMSLKPAVSFDLPTISRMSGSMNSFSRSRILCARHP